MPPIAHNTKVLALLGGLFIVNQSGSILAAEGPGILEEVIVTASRHLISCRYRMSGCYPLLDKSEYIHFLLRYR